MTLLTETLVLPPYFLPTMQREFMTPISTTGNAHKREVGVTVPPRVRLFESDEGLVAVVDTDGDGTRPESQKLREIVQQVLARNDCASWKFEERRYDPEKYL